MTISHPPSRVSIDTSQARVVIENIPDRPGTAAAIFGALAEAGIAVDLILENFGRDGRTSLTFTLPEYQRHKAYQLVSATLSTLGGELIMHGPIAKLTVSTGDKTRTAAAQVFQALAKASVNIHMISTSDSAIAVVISPEDAPRASAIVRETFSS